MTVWRPEQRIRAIVIGIAIRDGRILAVDVENDAGAIKGVRPPGGAIEFGETREAALRREFREELNTEVDILGPWTVVENIYEHEGQKGHEFVFAAAIRLADEALYRREEISVMDAVPTRARWLSLDALRSGKTVLFPDGLGKLLDGPEET